MTKNQEQSEISKLAAILESQGYNIVSLNYEETCNKSDRLLPPLTGCIQIKVLPGDKPVSSFLL